MQKKTAQPSVYSTSPAEGNVAGIAEHPLDPLVSDARGKTIAGIAEHPLALSHLTHVEKTIAGIAEHPLGPLVSDARGKTLWGGFTL